LNKRLAGPRGRPGRLGRDKSLSLLGIELRFVCHPTLNQDTIIDHTIPAPSFSLEFAQL